MTAPIALTVHPGGGVPALWRRELIAEWLTANGVDPKHVSADDPITVLTVPFRPPQANGEGPWLVQVIVLAQYYVNEHGDKEQDLIRRKPITFQRTVPLTVPFPAEPTTAAGGTTHGEADRQEAEQAPEEVVRTAREAQIPHTGQSSRQERSGEGSTERIEKHPEKDQGQGHEEVPEPEEDRRKPEEEVGGP